MVKGINRNVIEISDTESDLFERAILFVRTDRGGEDPAHLEASARSFLKKATLRRRIFQSRCALYHFLGYLLALFAGACIAVFLFSA